MSRQPAIRTTSPAASMPPAAWNAARLAACAALVLPVAAMVTPSARADERVLAPGPFQSVHITGSARVQFTQGPVERVVIEGDAEQREAVQIDVNDQVLTIRPTGSWRFWEAHRAQIRITAPTLARVSISGAADWSAPSPVEADRLSVNIAGSGNVRFDQLKAQRLTFAVSGSGDGRVAGTAGELSVSIAGRSAFDAEQLQAERAKLSISGIGNVKLWATDDLTVSVAGVGTVDYWGSPSRVKRSVAGQASINDRGPKKAAAPVN